MGASLQSAQALNMKFIPFTLPVLLYSAVFSTLALAQSSVTTQVPAAPSGQRISMGDFSIDATEVSIGRFAEYAARKQLVTAAEKEGGGQEYVMGWQKRPGWTWRTPFGQPAGADEPAVHLSWYEAQAFCQDAGGALPTKAQWSKAAYTEQRASPPEPFVQGKTYPFPTGDRSEGANVVGDADGWARHAPVGRTPAGVNGLYDMGANVWEWLADAEGDTRLTAGGSWWYGPSQMRLEGMQYKPARLFVVYVGFRCVY